MRYWHYVGIPKDRTFIVPYTSHLDYFRKESVKHAAGRSELRRQLEIAEESVLGIFVGRLITEKALDVLLQGLAMLDPQQRPQLLLVGEGPERVKLERIVRENSLPVKFLGFRQNHELPALYAASDFFVLSSRREAWGVVVAEAMASGLPVVLSDRVGATSDLLEDGRNGFLVTGGTASDWCNALKRCMNARGKWQAMSERSRSLISGWNCEKSVNQCMAALKVALAGKSGRGAGSRETY